MSETAPEEILDIINRRSSIIKLIEDGVTDKSIITDEVAVSRQTVGRAVRELEEVGVISTNGSDISLTTGGEIYQEWYKKTIDRYERILGAETVVNHIGDDINLNNYMETGTSIIEGGSGFPHKILSEIKSCLESSNRLTICLPQPHPHLFEAISMQLSEDIALSLLIDATYEVEFVSYYAPKFKNIHETASCDVRFLKHSFENGYIVSGSHESFIISFNNEKLVGGLYNRSDDIAARVESKIEQIISDSDMATDHEMNGVAGDGVDEDLSISSNRKYSGE